MSIKDNVKKILKDIPSNVILVAASKTRSVDEIRKGVAAGIKIIGENYTQEAERKKNALKGKVKMHCIGHLQSNKVKKAVEIFDMIQTVDSEKMAKEIDKRCFDIEKKMPVLIELNIGEEEGKNGCVPPDVDGLASSISKLKNLRLKGLMTMGPNLDAEKLRPYFRKAKRLFDRLVEEGYDLEVLSMGMSDSYKVAIEEGANMIRIGSVIFGNRNQHTHD